MNASSLLVVFWNYSLHLLFFFLFKDSMYKNSILYANSKNSRTTKSICGKQAAAHKWASCSGFCSFYWWALNLTVCYVASKAEIALTFDGTLRLLFTFL